MEIYSSAPGEKAVEHRRTRRIIAQVQNVAGNSKRKVLSHGNADRQLASGILEAVAPCFTPVGVIEDRYIKRVDYTHRITVIGRSWGIPSSVILACAARGIVMRNKICQA